MPVEYVMAPDDIDETCLKLSISWTRADAHLLLRVVDIGTDEWPG